MKAPSELAVQKAIALIRKRGANVIYFFQRLDSPAWIGPLRENQLFEEVPGAKREGDSVSFPFWPQSDYLARMATHGPAAAEAVLETFLRLPETDNQRVHEDAADAALAMPPRFSARLMAKELRELRNESFLYLLLPEKLGRVVAHLARGSQIEPAIDLARFLLELSPPGRSKEWLFEEPRPRFELWSYEQFLREDIPQLVAAAGEPALHVLCDTLDQAVECTEGNEEDSTNDSSAFWRPAIEDHEQNLSHGVRDALVEAVRDGAVGLVSVDRKLLRPIVEHLDRRPWFIFHRLALYVLAEFATEAADLVSEHLVDENVFHQLNCRHEYTRLLCENFHRLTERDRGVILSWVEAGPPQPTKRARIQGALPSRIVTDELLARQKQMWQRDRLAPLRASLPKVWRSRLDDLVAEYGPPEHPEFPVYSTGVWVGPTSPKDENELRGMTTTEVVEFLSQWTPSGDSFADSPEGLARALTSVVHSESERFADAAMLFRDLEPTYVRALFDGLYEAVREKTPFDWTQPLALAKSIVSTRPTEVLSPSFEYEDRDPGWIWTRQAIARLIGQGLSEPESGLMIQLRSSLWSILEPLTHDPNPSYALPGEPVPTEERDPANESINTVRGEAIHSVLRYALWVRRTFEKDENGASKLANGLDEIPEVRRTLDHHLDPNVDAAPAIRSIYGQWFPWFVLIDERWARANTSRVFSDDELGRIAWRTYVRFCRPYKNVFGVLGETYAQAVERLTEAEPDASAAWSPERRLAEHLMIFHAWGTLDESGYGQLVHRFFEVAPLGIRARDLSFGGWNLARTESAADPEKLRRLQTLWDVRWERIRDEWTEVSETDELAAFGSWFTCQKFPEDWALRSLEGVLNLSGRIEGAEQVLEKLAAVSAEHLATALRCLEVVIGGAEEPWLVHHLVSASTKLFERTLRFSGTRREAERLANEVAARGFLDLRAIVAASQQSKAEHPNGTA